MNIIMDFGAHGGLIEEGFRFVHILIAGGEHRGQPRTDRADGTREGNATLGYPQQRMVKYQIVGYFLHSL